MQTVQIGAKVRVNTKWGEYHVGHAPDGGRTVNGGIIHEKPFAFLYTGGKAVVADRNYKSGFENVPTILLGEQFIIEGYGVHILKHDRFMNDDVECVRVEDGFSSLR